MGSIETAASRIREADHILITAGAGMGVDSGLPDFRGSEGFWEAYPPYRKLGLDFIEIASPGGFILDPRLAWGFYGHRLHLYRETEPHEGFGILRRWAGRKRSHFVFTSNVDGQFQKAGFDPDLIYEVHGSTHHLQCTRPCSEIVWSAGSVNVSVDRVTMRAAGRLPSCPECGGLARPNVVLFGDFGYRPSRQNAQEARFQSFLDKVGTEGLVVVELGAGIVLPTVRHRGERLTQTMNARLVRINARDADCPRSEVSLQMGALEALRRIDASIGD